MLAVRSARRREPQKVPATANRRRGLVGLGLSRQALIQRLANVPPHSTALVAIIAAAEAAIVSVEPDTSVAAVVSVEGGISAVAACVRTVGRRRAIVGAVGCIAWSP